MRKLLFVGAICFTSIFTSSRVDAAASVRGVASTFPTGLYEYGISCMGSAGICFASISGGNIYAWTPVRVYAANPVTGGGTSFDAVVTKYDEVTNACTVEIIEEE